MSLKGKKEKRKKRENERMRESACDMCAREKERDAYQNMTTVP